MLTLLIVTSHIDIYCHTARKNQCYRQLSKEQAAPAVAVVAAKRITSTTVAAVAVAKVDVVAIAAEAVAVGVSPKSKTSRSLRKY